jgi:hypothetical protein
MYYNDFYYVMILINHNPEKKGKKLLFTLCIQKLQCQSWKARYNEILNPTNAIISLFYVF